MPYPTGKKVAIIGADAASLAAGAHLALLGHKPVVFTAQSDIPGCDGLERLGVEIVAEYPLGPGVCAATFLAHGFDAVLVGSEAATENMAADGKGVFTCGDAGEQTAVALDAYLQDNTSTWVRLGRIAKMQRSPKS